MQYVLDRPSFYFQGLSSASDDGRRETEGQGYGGQSGAVAFQVGPQGHLVPAQSGTHPGRGRNGLIGCHKRIADVFSEKQLRLTSLSFAP
jgi:hypothetical protein